MKMLKWLWPTIAVLAFAACGGSVSTSTDDGGGDGGGNTPTAASLELLSSANQVGTGGDEVTITVFVKDANNVSLAAAPVTIAADSGTLTATSTVTNENGVATAKLSAGADRTNRSIAVSATSGGKTGRIEVLVAGSTLTVAGASTVPLSASATLTVKATDSKGNVVADAPITVSSRLGNTTGASTVRTDSQGNAVVPYVATNAGEDRVTFDWAGTTAFADIQISSENFAFVAPAPSSTVVVGVPQNVTVRYLSGGAPQPGRTVNFASTSGTVTPTSGVTNAQGEITVAIASNSASQATIQATLVTPAAQATLPVEFIATVPATLVLQVNPAALGPNPAGSTAQQAQVIATVKDANGNPVKDKTVNFNRAVDPSGGNLNQVSALTNSSGQASVQYIAGPLSTASNGVQLRAEVAEDIAVSNSVQLTVNQSALFIGLGTGNVIENLDVTTYEKDWTVYVTDANGIPVSDVTLTIKALPNRFRKGSLGWNGKRWVYTTPLYTCDNEDENFNGVLDSGEDFNPDLNPVVADRVPPVLEPGNVISVLPGIVRTDKDGRVQITLRYAESYVPWVEIRLRAEAIVGGTESSTESTFFVEGASTDFTNENIAPAGVTSPFGTGPCTSVN